MAGKGDRSASISTGAAFFVKLSEKFLGFSNAVFILTEQAIVLDNGCPRRDKAEGSGMTDEG